jgi:hypothetical protein
MKHFVKWGLSPASGEVPRLEMQVVERQCCHCGSMMRFPVPEEYTDWEYVAKEYKAMLEKWKKRMDGMMCDIDAMYPHNPIREYIMNEWRFLKEQMESDFRGKRRC